jgi:hypothetical protein
MAFPETAEREAVQALALDIMEIVTNCAAIATTVKGRMATTIRTQSKAAADDAGVRPAIFYVATQGDETIWMGPAIEQHVNDGRYVIVVLLTDGGASTVLASTGLSRQDFTAARDREMVAALARYGVLEGQIFPEHLFDGYVTRQSAGRVIAKWVSMFPGGSHKTTSYLSSNTQAKWLGFGMNDVSQRRVATDVTFTSPLDVRLYVPRPDWGKAPSNAFYQAGGQKTLDALYEYTVNKPQEGRYGISQRTVPDAFTAAQADNRVLVHPDSALPI